MIDACKLEPVTKKRNRHPLAVEAGRLLFLAMLVALLSLPACPSWAAAASANGAPVAGPPGDQQEANVVLLETVWKDLLAVAKGPAGLAWPPQLHVLTEAEMKAVKMDPRSPNAFATLYKGAPLVCVNRALLNTIVEGNTHRLAFILGHELSHILLGHVRRAPAARTLFVQMNFTRSQELAADKRGMEIALAANYSFREAVGAAKRFIELGMEYPPLWPADHPSWTQRLALLEKDRTMLWKSMGAFNNGVLFLNVEQYVSAAQCFASVIEEFPDCYEAQANLGYARLMQYCDLLRPEDVRDFGIGQIMVGGFYERPDSLIEKGRGKNIELWQQAVASFEAALRMQPDLMLAKTMLGIAYLVQPEGKDIEKASRYLGEAASAATSNNRLPPAIRAVVLINLSVADLAAGKADLSEQHLRDAYRLAGNVAVIRATILYNHAQSLLQSGNAEQKREAAKALNAFLKMASPASIWWKLGLDSYSSLCGELGLKRETEQQIRAGVKQSFRPLPPVEVSQGVRVQLGDAIEDVQKRLGASQSVPVVRGTDLKRMSYAKYGIDVIGDQNVVAISLNSATSPALVLQAAGSGGQTKTVKVGMTLQQVTQVLGPTATTATVFSPAIAYKFYPQVGLAARVVGGRVAEWLVVVLPRRG